MAKPVDITEQSFEQEVLGASGPVLVDFWAPWCAPCRQLAPIVEELAGEYEGRVAFGKLNTDESPNIARRYGVYSIPTLIVFKAGEPVKQVVGLRPKKDLKNSLEEVLGT
jgi:thioredoxin 1